MLSVYPWSLWPFCFGAALYVAPQALKGGLAIEIKLLKYPSEEDWLLVKKCALRTVGKDSNIPPTSDWRRRILEARHSPIRELSFVFEIRDVPYWVAMHLTRHHVGAQPYIQSQRNDRQDKYDRCAARQDEPVDMIWSLNGEAVMTIANKRLCRLAAWETRLLVMQMCNLVESACPEYKGLLVPMCRWRNGLCDEMMPCYLIHVDGPGAHEKEAFHEKV